MGLFYKCTDPFYEGSMPKAPPPNTMLERVRISVHNLHSDCGLLHSGDEAKSQYQSSHWLSQEPYKEDIKAIRFPQRNRDTSHARCVEVTQLEIKKVKSNDNQI